MTIDWVAKALIVLLLFKPTTSWANDIYLYQIGDDVTVTITQDGENNKIGSLSNISGQAYIGSLDGASLSYTQTGDNNELGLYNADIGESNVTSVQTGDNNEAVIDCHGEDCTMSLTQTGNNNTAHLEVGSGYSDSNNNITGTQTGHNQDIYLEVNSGSNNTITAEQYCTEGASCTTSDMDVNITGSTNSVAVVQGRLYDNNQGSLSTDLNEPGGLTMDIDITGSNNSLMMSQRNQSANHAHNMDVDITGNYNSVFGTQVGAGSKDIDIDLSGNANAVSVVQGGNASHSATLNLSAPYGPAYSINLTQNASTAKTYTMTGTCANPNGCAYTVTQN